MTIPLVEGIQLTEFDAVMSIDESANNDTMQQHSLANITHYKFRQKGLITGKAALTLLLIDQGQIKIFHYSLIVL